MKFYYVYLITNYKNSTLYTGVTSNLEKRIYEHRKVLKRNSFSSKYKLKKLVYYEQHRNINSAIKREKQIKGWIRKKKNHLIESINPDWSDLMGSDSS